MKNEPHNSKSLLSNRRQSKQDKKIYIDFLRKTVLRELGTTYVKLKKSHSQDYIFFVALQHVTTTKKAICTAFGLTLENQCRTKRKLEKRGLLVQTYKKHRCKFTGNPAHYLTTNPSKFNEILYNFKK